MRGVTMATKNAERERDASNALKSYDERQVSMHLSFGFSHTPNVFRLKSTKIIYIIYGCVRGELEVIEDRRPRVVLVDVRPERLEGRAGRLAVAVSAFVDPRRSSLLVHLGCCDPKRQQIRLKLTYRFGSKKRLEWNMLNTVSHASIGDSVCVIFILPS